MKITKLITGLTLGCMITLFIHAAESQNAIAKTPHPIQSLKNNNISVPNVIAPGFPRRRTLQNSNGNPYYEDEYRGPGNTCFSIAARDTKYRDYTVGGFNTVREIPTSLFGKVLLQSKTSQQASTPSALSIRTMLIPGVSKVKYSFYSGGDCKCLSVKQAENIVRSLKRI